MRKEIRWRETMLETMTRRPGQTQAEVDRIRNRIEQSLAFDRKVLAELDALSARARKLAESALEV